MNWFVNNILFFIFSILPLVLVFWFVYYFIKNKKIPSNRLVRALLVLFSAFFLVLLSFLINMIVSVQIENTIESHYNNLIGKPVDSKEKIPAKTTPWYSVMPLLIPDENSLMVIIEKDTVRGVVIH